VRTVTVEVGTESSLVVDSFGRTNGFSLDGKRVIQTPGAQVKRDGDRVVIVLPDESPQTKVDPKKVVETPKAAGNAQDLAKKPQLIPSVPAVPNAPDNSKDNKGAHADPSGSSQSDGNDASTEDHGPR
jgi:hypothetical protein